MKVTALKTAKIRPGDDLLKILDDAIDHLEESSVVAITSKIIALCENRVVPFGQTTKDDLIKQEARLYLDRNLSKYHQCFSIIQNTLIASAGIDESNSGGYYVLWPAEPQDSANQIRQYLRQKYSLKNLGVIITDSTCQPLRRGVSGIFLGYSGFKALNNYIGKPDLFGKPFSVSQASIASGLAATTVLIMGEGSEQTPIAVMNDLPFIEFSDEDPTPEEIAENIITPEDDLFAPLIQNAPWQKGQGK